MYNWFAQSKCTNYNEREGPFKRSDSKTPSNRTRGANDEYRDGSGGSVDGPGSGFGVLRVVF